MRRALDYDLALPTSLILPFFLNVPVFLLLAALLLGLEGPLALASRWHPAALAVVHLVVLGAMASAMTGALMQILPVASRVRFPWPRLVGRLTHAGLSAGAALLALWLWRPALAPAGAAAIVLLSASLGGWALACFAGLWRDRRQAADGAQEVLMAACLAPAALLVTVGLGASLAAARLGWLPAWPLTDLHAAWGLAGWTGLLLVGVAGQLVPIFLATDRYPPTLPGRLSLAICALLVMLSVNTLASPGAPGVAAWVIVALLAIMLALFALRTLRLLLRQRGAPMPDPANGFWRLGMLALLALPVAWMWPSAPPAAVGVLGLAAAISAISGLLYRIVPFLLWRQLHTDVGQPVAGLPKLRDYLPPRPAQAHLYLHAGAVAGLLLACAWAPATRPAALLLALSALWQLAGLLAALGRDRRCRRELARAGLLGAQGG